MSRFSKLLVANRGEIAVRVLRSARALGYRTVAVYSEADALALHPRSADEAVLIGPAPASQSYLSIERLLAAARKTGADAVHPGYGFLAENADFAQACGEAGLVFVGPPPAAIRLMGDKAAAKAHMLAAGVPCVPGYNGEEQAEARLCAEAARIGLPVMIKAAAGGGGRGMRAVASEAELRAALGTARAEAESAFGDGRLILEKLVANARHIEVQVLADEHGTVMHLGERDCSVQRRHQKVVEEAPSPFVGPELRARLGEAAVRAASAIGYVGAGTVEFLADAAGDFYFMEMNTRLQVEHPVTELLFGLDLVALQLDVAAGRKLDIRPGPPRGHAIEARLYAEDPAAGFTPQTGAVLAFEPPVREGVRVDHGLRPGQPVTSDYDALLAKIIAHGRDREEARRRLVAALEETLLLGVGDNRRFLVELLSHERFVAGEVTTSIVAECFPPERLAGDGPEPRHWALAAALLCAAEGARDGWSTTGALAWPVDLACGCHERRCRVARRGRDSYVVTLDGEAEPQAIELFDREGDSLRWGAAGVVGRATAIRTGNVLHLAVGGETLRFAELEAGAAEAEAAAEAQVRAPMSGRVIEVRTEPGARVERGQCVVVLESMKMQQELRAGAHGEVRRVLVRAGDQVATAQLLVDLEAV